MSEQSRKCELGMILNLAEPHDVRREMHDIIINVSEFDTYVNRVVYIVL